MRFDILTIFPDIIYNYCSESILRRAQRAGLIEIGVHNFRDYTTNKHQRVDDTPYGGGAGMILQVQPIYECLKAIKAGKAGGARKAKKEKIIILDPAGKKFDQRLAEKFSKLDRLILICGRYEGFDERVYKFADEKISVGDYVLSGGELPALTVVEAVARLVSGVLGNEASLAEETHNKFKKEAGSFAEYPQYTRPENFRGLKVPKVLLSGDHALIKDWRKKQSK